MLVTLMCEDKLYDLLLPAKIRGRYWIEDSDLEITNPKRKMISIEGENGAWKIYAGRKLKLYDSRTAGAVAQLELETGKIYPVELQKRKGYIFTETYTKDRCTFRKYAVQPNSTINIGQSSGNEIVIDNPYVSSIHAQLSLTDDTWTICDNNSKNGIYVNGKRRYHSTVLHAGDALYILGVKIVFGYQFLAVNNPDGTVRLNEHVLRQYQAEALQPYEMPEELGERMYYRSPRFEREIVPLTLKIDAPTAQEKEDDTPLALSLAPSLVMGVASFSSGLVAMAAVVRNGGNIASAVPTFIMSFSMLTGMVVFPFIMKYRDRKKKKERELERRTKYLKYLENVRAEIYKATSTQQEILKENYPFLLSQVKEKDFYDLQLWSRVIGRQNFLTLRVGVGNAPLRADLSFPEQRFSIDDDIMREEVNRFSGEKQVIAGVPVVYSLIEHRVSGIVGEGKNVHGILNHILVQIAALHSYDEVKVVFLCDESSLEKYDYVKWMPHIWDNDFRVRFLAANPEEVRNLSSYFLREMEKYRGEIPAKIPHYVVISTSKALSDGCAFLNELLKDETLYGFSYLAAYDELKNLPKECTMILQTYETQSDTAADGIAQGIMFHYREAGGEQFSFVPDLVSKEEARRVVMEVAGYRLDLQAGRYALPDMLTFLDMFKAGKLEHLNIANRWKASNSVATLRAPVGVNSDGRLFYLDLHEEAHGPHGLIAGMTGSGKSEFIITYVLSLAVNYSPEDVAFILIDYKGGGLVGAFDSDQYHLPHLAGTITNLDGAAVTRALLSIQSELKRRQRIFLEARRAANEGTMDIYKYQKLYRAGVVTKPVPHLLIISDEFAELKSQQPEFMNQLISTARIGRSLGVHLILATQKPSGVVSDQIWSNSKFKVCLKVQDRADSMEMLKRPDAAELVETGRFYLQVGYNELFELGQSAWCGAPYLPVDTAMAEQDEQVQMIDRQGNIVGEAKPQERRADSGQAKKQIVEIVQHLTRIAEEEKAGAEPLWLPEIPARIKMEELEKKYRYQKDFTLNPIIGEADDPANQEQRLLTLPFTEKGNAVCYGSAASGKEEFLCAVLYALYRYHTSDEVNAYILDFGAETLQMFESAPQTGGFAVSGEDEKIVNLFQMLGREMARRKKLFASVGGDYLSYCRKGNTEVPGIVVIINEYANFAEQYEALDDRMASLTRDCTKYGIYFLITNLSQIGIRFRLQQNFSQVFVLQMNDKADYATILGNTYGVYPSRLLGRGIYREKEVYEFQTACVAAAPEETVETVRAFCEKLRKSGQKPARQIPILPRAVYRKHFGRTAISFGQIPIGINTSTIEPVFMNLRKGSVEKVFAMDKQDTVAFVEGIVNVIQQDALDCELYVIDPEKLLPAGHIDSGHYISGQIEDVICRLFWMAVERNNAYKSAGGTVPDTVDMHPVVTILMGLGQIKKQLTADGADKLQVMLEKTRGRYGLFFWVIDDYQSTNSYSAEGWCNGEGIWIGNGIEGQMRFMIDRQNMIPAKDLDFTSGYLVRKAKAQPIRLLISDRIVMEEEDE